MFPIDRDRFLDLFGKIAVTMRNYRSRKRNPAFALDFNGTGYPIEIWEIGMPANRKTMRKIKEVIRPKFEAGLSHERVAAAIGVSKEGKGR